MSVERLTPEAIDALARGIVDGSTYFANTAEAIEESFGTWLFLIVPREREHRLELAQTTLGIYESMEHRAAHFVNGFPQFMSGHFLHIDDWPLLNGKLDYLGYCRRCRKVAPPIQDRICGSCADDLRESEKERESGNHSRG